MGIVGGIIGSSFMGGFTDLGIIAAIATAAAFIIAEIRARSGGNNDE
jgi:hypothetical protein